MGFLERAIRKGVAKGVGQAVGNALSKAVEPKVTELTNKAANTIDETTREYTGNTADTAGLKGAFSNLERAVGGYATEMSKNMKLCPKCGKPASSDKKFCPECGEPLPETTLAQSSVCTHCGKQNNIGTKFCSECGAKLPIAIQEEEAKQRRNAEVMAEWDALLAVYPRWSCGGEISIEDYGSDGVSFSACFEGDEAAAHRAVDEYRQILQQNGFRPAGQYPSVRQLFKRIDGIVYNVDTEHCFEGDPDRACIGFCKREPYGGFDYVKPEPKKKMGFKDLLGL